MNAEFLSFYLEKNAQVMNNFSWADFTNVVKIDTFHILSKVKTGWKLKIVVCQGILYGFNISNYERQASVKPFWTLNALPPSALIFHFDSYG